MKATGIVRKIDDLGRIVLPRELRNKLGIREKDMLEIFVDGDYIMLKKYEMYCVFCDGEDNLTIFQGKNVCGKCLGELKNKS